jgi:hypothetical protein
MRVSVNEEFIRRRANLTRWTSLIGLGVLFLGLLASFNQQYFYLSLPALAIGLFLASISGFNANRYVKEPRPDQILAKVLRGFDKNYHLFSYTASIPHVLLTPSRVYAMQVKPHDGVIRRQGQRWRRDFSLRRIIFLFGEEGLGNPTRDALAAAQRLQRELDEAFLDEAPTVEPLIVFTHPQVQLEIIQSPVGEGDEMPTLPLLSQFSARFLKGSLLNEGGEVPALVGSQLKKFIRAQPRGETFKADLRKRLTDFFRGSKHQQGDAE